jgi:hypothetical protein
MIRLWMSEMIDIFIVIYGGNVYIDDQHKKSTKYNHVIIFSLLMKKSLIFIISYVMEYTHNKYGKTYEKNMLFAFFQYKKALVIITYYYLISFIRSICRWFWDDNFYFVNTLTNSSIIKQLLPI